MSEHSVDAPAACSYTSYEEGEVPDELPATGEDAVGVERHVWNVLYDVEDPEMPVSIVDLGLIYGVSVDDGVAHVDMTLTYSGCPARELLVREVETAVEALESIESVDFQLVYAPPWNVDMVTEEGREQLGKFGLSI